MPGIGINQLVLVLVMVYMAFISKCHKIYITFPFCEIANGETFGDGDRIFNIELLLTLIQTMFILTLTSKFLATLVALHFTPVSRWVSQS